MKKMFIAVFPVISLVIVLAGCATPGNSSIDSDKDGVANYMDVCPNTPTLALVDKYGCALDSDKDGVIDLYDKCPNTPITDLVNKNGCSVKTIR